MCVCDEESWWGSSKVECLAVLVGLRLLIERVEIKLIWKNGFVEKWKLIVSEKNSLRRIEVGSSD